MKSIEKINAQEGFILLGGEDNLLIGFGGCEAVKANRPESLLILIEQTSMPSFIEVKKIFKKVIFLFTVSMKADFLKKTK